MKTTIKTFIAGVFVTAFLVLSISCEREGMSSANVQYASVLDVSGEGTSTFSSGNMELALVETSGLVDTEIASLIKMKDEERLARDVYSALFAKWGNTIFSRISAAEDNHLNAIIRLLQYYGSSDTLIEEAGIFDNSDIQALYENLVLQGSESIGEAYKVGALIEEMDIKDLTNEIAAISNPNIILVFENLQKGSRNHLRSFYNQLTALGVVYTPVYITQSEYNQIVASPVEKGKQYKMQGKGNRQGKNTGLGNCNGNGQVKQYGKP